MTVYYPYLIKKHYCNGTINVTSTNASENLKKKFTSFLDDFYEENGSFARIKHDTKTQTVSEGIGYGMIMMVYFSDTTLSYQPEFDKLWAYYNKYLDQKGLMNWKIDGFGNAIESGSATDAEFDVAFALIMAHYQFGDQKYLKDATNLIEKIRINEMEANGLHKPGDMWNDKRNPSYVSPAAFELFIELFKDLDQASFWKTALTRNYELLKNNQNLSTGLFSDWCLNDGSPAEDKNRGFLKHYGYNAARVPWRLAWANAWYGHQEAKTLLANLDARFLSSKNAADIGGPIQLDGNMGNDKNSTFVGPFTNAFSYSSSNLPKMNNYWETLINFNEETYYNAALQILTGLLATGNMPNLKI